MALSGTDLINNFQLYFDAADKANSSLYLCIGPDMTDAEVQAIIAVMRAENLWSAEPAKTVPDAQKPMYAKEMTFIGQVSARSGGKTFHAAAYNHPKFAYNPARWEAWQALLARKFR